ncbi:hypothetical protein AB0K34_14190 [Actinomadura sp. NPDC049382]|uniref:hypothetical protein n=1 Tax=Actinomadura sp. NPDC049382 TaxID=3158220 RepID=UPI00343B5AEB
MAKMTPEELQRDRIVSSYLRAQAALDTAARAIKAPLPHNPGTVQVLKTAQKELDWYLSELEKAGG